MVRSGLTPNPPSLARRPEEKATVRVSGVSKAEWLDSLEKRPSSGARAPQADPLSGFSERAIAALMVVAGTEDVQALKQQLGPRKTDPRRGVRTLPFGKATFRRLTRALRIHGSISKAVSRSDVPMFSVDQVEMGKGAPAYGNYIIYLSRPYPTLSLMNLISLQLPDLECLGERSRSVRHAFSKDWAHSGDRIRSYTRYRKEYHQQAGPRQARSGASTLAARSLL